jgi:hypothetical protein
MPADNRASPSSPKGDRRSSVEARSGLVWPFFMIAQVAVPTIFLLSVGSGGEPELLASALVRDGWIQLFDGSSLYGWTATSDANWTVRDKTLVVDSGEPGFLRSNSEFADFELSLEFDAGRQTNSGVFVRSSVVPLDPKADCYEINIAPDTNPFPTGSVVAHERSELPVPFKAGWRTMHVVCRDMELCVSIDGAPAVRLGEASARRRGHILLQYNTGRVRFRKIRIHPLKMQPIRIDMQLTHWQQYPSMAGRFSARSDGTLHVSGGPGQLETTTSHADFVLQLECRTNADNLNSGVFFRCIPGDRMMGYESQIHNGFDHDPTTPLDGGTGAIFRRCNARRIVARDREWFIKTIAANGPHFAVWVNGYLVSDWTDDRAPDPNPRKGVRLEPGTIMLQAHDPTTDVDFRNFRIQDLDFND